MEYTDADPTFRARFVEQKFDPDTFVQSIASKSIGSTDLVSLKGRMHLISSEAKTDLKQTVYGNHKKFIETAKQVALLESEVYQLNALLGDEKQLLNTVKDLLNIENKLESNEISDSYSWETFLRHCQSLGLISLKSDRELIYSGKFLDVKSENLTQKSISYNTQPSFGLLFTDCLILVKTSNIHTATAYDVDQVIKLHRSSNTNKFHFSSASIQVINVKDEIIRNAFAIQSKLDTLIMICESAQVKKQWMEMLESVLYKDSKDYLRSISQSEEEEFFAEEWVKTIREQLEILLAERNFNQTLKLINQAKGYISEFESKYPDQSFDFVDEFIKYIKNKQQELYRLIEKEVLYICEKGCTTNLLKHYYQHIQLLKELGYISKACDLFFLLQISLMKNTLKQTKVEEQNVVFVENFTNTFFTRLVDSYYEFVQIFKDQKWTFSKYMVWLDNELEKLVNLLHNQQYISSKNFTFSMKNTQILLNKSQEFSLKLIDIQFQIYEQLEPIIIPIIRSQKEFIIDTLRQRHQEEKWIPITFQTHERLEQLLYEFYQLGFDGQKHIEPFVQYDLPDDAIQIDLAPSTLQFTKAYLTFAKDLYQIHFQLINHIVVEALIELIKLHLKYYERALKKLTEKNLRDFIMKNVRFSLEHLCAFVEQLYKEKIGHETKFFTKVYRKMDKFEELAQL